MLQKEVRLSKKTWIIISIVTAFVFALMIGGYFAWAYWQDQEQKKADEKAAQDLPKKSDEYGDWLTYTNSDVGYKLRYPKDWSIKEKNGPSEVTEVIVKYITFTSAKGNSLHFGLKKTADTFYLSDRTGIGAGEDIPLANKTTLLSAEIIPNKHVWEGKTKEYFYKMADSEEPKCGCEASIYFSPPLVYDSDATDMSTEEIHTVNVILKSVQWLSGAESTDAEKLKNAKDVASKFLDARKTRSLTNATPYVTADYLKNTTTQEFAGTSSPSFGNYSIDAAKYLQSADLYEVTATTHWFLQGTESGTETWKIYVVNQNGKFLVNEVKFTD